MANPDKKVEELKEKILSAQKNGDIASLYILEHDANELLAEEVLHGYYQNILDLALERLTQTLEAHVRMDMQEVQDFATVRALYEYAVENYSAGSAKDAAALFEVLAGLTNDQKFSDALKMHWAAAGEGISLENFIDKIADVNATQAAGTFYISAFTNEAQKLLDKSQTTEDDE
ncbi:hypothetical protein [Sulfurimonas sp.]|uniref:hypothetical protein n=1 Tax=Sulfurimonas sp. TaxID=2022749 RepID=UPI0035633CBD